MDTAGIRELVAQRITEVEDAVQSIQTARRSLLSKSHEMKQSILSSFVDQRDEMQNREMRLLSQVDVVLYEKDDALLTQLGKLNQVLGCLRNCLSSPHPCGECLEKFEDIDIATVDDLSMEFKSVNSELDDAWIAREKNTVRVTPTITPKPLKMEVTKWLLAPMFAAQSDVGKEEPKIPRETTAGWLIGNRSSAKGAGEHFVSVKSSSNDGWLAANENRDADRDADPVPRSLFGNIQADNQQHWLYQAHSESITKPIMRSRAVSNASSEESSCVIISSRAESECGGIYEWFRPLALPTNDWLTRSSKSSNDWLVLSSTAPKADSDWVVTDAVKVEPIKIVPSRDWLANEKGHTDWIISDKLADDLLMEDEKMTREDDWPEKRLSVAEWVCTSPKQAGGIGLWLSSEEKLTGERSFKSDKDWLAILAHLNEISMSNGSDWLISQ